MAFLTLGTDKLTRLQSWTHQQFGTHLQSGTRLQCSIQGTGLLETKNKDLRKYPRKYKKIKRLFLSK